MVKAIPIMFALTFSLAACHKENAKQNKMSTSETADSVKTFRLTAEKFEKHISIPGELIPLERVEIRPKVNGYIKQLKVDIGSAVKKGEIIVAIDAPEIQSRLGEGKGRVNAAKAKYESTLDTYKRILEASETPGVVSASELQKARNQMLADSADYEAQRFTYESYKQVGNYLVITAPFNGIVTQRNVHDGSYVGNPNEKPIVVIEDNRKLRLRVAVPEALTGVALKENKVQFFTKGNPEKRFEAVLMRKSGSLDITTRTEIWEFEVDNKDNTLKAGAFANVNLNVSRAQPSFTVPFSAVVTTLERKFVIKLHRDSTRRVDVSQGINLSDRVEIFGSLKSGDTLILKANEEIKAGTKMYAIF
jgi:membrane fusion protein (multidrug efflux system)